MTDSLRTALISIILVTAGSICAPSAFSEQVDDGDVIISILTMLPGDELYSAWGHTGIRLQYADRDQDVVFNYGTFDFDTPNFYIKFLRGQLDYLLTVESFDRVLRTYQYLERPVVEQTLNLDDTARERIVDFLDWNARPENQAYRYDFFFDNCSTRPRDVIELGLGEDIHYDPAIAERATFRNHIRPYLTDRPFTEFGINLLLGEPADQIADLRQEMFLPIQLMEILAGTSVSTDSGTRPLVARTDTLFWFEGADTVERSIPWPHFLLWTLFAVGLYATISNASGRRPIRFAWRVADGTGLFVVGLLGALICFMWFGTEHNVTAYNWNILWALPTHAVAGGLLIRSPGMRLLRRYMVFTAVVTSAALLGWYAWPQSFHSAVVPLMLLIILRTGWLGYILRPVRQVHEAEV